jgi:prolyl-tRNA editing enzyme YbaK/EbsC (Cys-tRNA(Pro) deacylase)
MIGRKLKAVDASREGREMAKQDKKAAERVEAQLAQHSMGKRLVKVKAPRGTGDPLAGWATALDVPLGAMVRTLVVLVGETPALMLIAGDRQALVQNVPRALNLQGEARIATDDETLDASGFAAGSVPPVGLAQPLPIVLDRSLKRFATVYCPAGRTDRLFSVTVDELKRLTGCIVSWNVAEAEGAGAGAPALTGADPAR